MQLASLTLWNCTAQCWVSSTAFLPQFPHLFPFSPSYRVSSYECHFYWLYFLHFSSLKTKEYAFLLGQLWHHSESRSWLHLLSEQDCICSFSDPLPVPSPALFSRSLWQPLCGRLPKSLTTRTLLGIRQRTVAETASRKQCAGTRGGHKESCGTWPWSQGFPISLG